MFKYSFLFLIFLFSSCFAADLQINKKEILDSHNKLRALYKSAPLKYSETLENSARKWARKLQKDGCHMVHSHGQVGDYGENLFWASPLITTVTYSNGKKKRIRKLQNISPSEVSQAWHDEVKFYNYEDGSCKKGEMCGHFTQLIWDTTQELGCAATSCDDMSQVWVCEYYPAGNISIQYPDGKVEKLKPYKK